MRRREKEKASSGVQSQNIFAKLWHLSHVVIVVINTPDTLLSSVHISLYPTLLSFHSYFVRSMADKQYSSMVLLRVLALTIWRILRCNPWGGSGY